MLTSDGTVKRDSKTGKFDLAEGSLQYAVLVLASLLLFSVYFKRIKSNFGGGNPYSKILILKERKGFLIKTDSLLHTDAMKIVYEDIEFICFERTDSIMSSRKEFIAGEILFK